jgi:hypothetical protein
MPISALFQIFGTVVAKVNAGTGFSQVKKSCEDKF